MTKEMDEATLHSLSLIEEQVEQIKDTLNVMNSKLNELEKEMTLLIAKNGEDRSSFSKRKIQQWLAITKK